MDSKEALEKLLMQCEIGHRSVKNRQMVKEMYEKVNLDLDVLEQFKKALLIERKPPRFDLNRTYSITDVMENMTIQYEYIADEITRQAFTKWIIDNFDKKVVRKWLEDDK